MEQRPGHTFSARPDLKALAPSFFPFPFPFLPQNAFPHRKKLGVQPSLGADAVAIHRATWRQRSAATAMALLGCFPVL